MSLVNVTLTLSWKLNSQALSLAGAMTSAPSLCNHLCYYAYAVNSSYRDIYTQVIATLVINMNQRCQ